MKLHYNQKLKLHARSLRKANILSEVILWSELKGKKLGVRFLRQRPIGNFIVDFFCNKLNLAIEIDGVSHNSKVEKDEERQRSIESRGVRFLRFLDSDVRHNLQGVLTAIRGCITSLENTPPPPVQVLPRKICSGENT